MTFLVKLHHVVRHYHFTRRWPGQAVPDYAAEERLPGNAGPEFRGLLVPVCMPPRFMRGRSAT